MNPLQLLLYDLDGTIVDSNELIVATFAKVFAEHLPQIVLTKADFVQMMGPPLLETFQTYVTDPDTIEAMIQTYLKHYRADEFDYLTVYPGMLEALKFFHEHGFKQLIVTTKYHSIGGPFDSPFRNRPMDRWRDRFGRCQTPQTRSRTNPLGDVAVPGMKAIMIGDNTSDILAGKNAGILTLGVRYSYKLDELKAANPDGWIENGTDLIRWVSDYNHKEEANGLRIL
ncbi:MAG: HAD hydrolase-like protein [Bacillus subtilis]|nr:HAD hydrolase-like protein [Bacillus subtilis]